MVMVVCKVWSWVECRGFVKVDKRWGLVIGSVRDKVINWKGNLFWFLRF